MGCGRLAVPEARVVWGMAEYGRPKTKKKLKLFYTACRSMIYLSVLLDICSVLERKL